MRAAFAALLLLAAALGLAGATQTGRLPLESFERQRPTQRPDSGFTSSDTCRACHPGQYNSWHASFHRTMTQVASPATVIPSFDNQTIAATQGSPMTLQARGRDLWAAFDDPDSPAPPAGRPRIERRVALVTGSHNQQVFWYETGHERVLGQLPSAYLVKEARWIPRRMAVLHPPSQSPLSETGHWNSTCLVCHATNGTPQFDSPFGSQPIERQRVQTRVAEFGIACEACHGPGEAHVRANRNPLRRYALHFSNQDDATITQPVRLEPTRASQVCGQCHAVWEFPDEASERAANATGLPFRPGDELSATRFVAQPTVNADSPVMRALVADDSGFIRDGFWPDGIVRVSGREYNGLIESPCYKDARTPERTLSCFSCHSLHKSDSDPRPLAEWADDQLAVSTRGPRVASTMDRESNEACLQCHEPIRAAVTAHTHHPEDSAGSRCYNCHMPYTTYGLLKTIRSHTVSAPSVKESVEAKRPNACNLCHLDRTLGWTQEALQRWYGTSPVDLQPMQESVAASLLWLLAGDAGQRAIVAQAMAWPPAQQASGTDWMAPHLARLLDDPYDAVRLGAARSMGTLPGMVALHVDVTAAPSGRRAAQLQVMAAWDRARAHPGRVEPTLLMTASGDVDVPRVLDVLKRRDNHPMLLRE